MGIFSNRRRIKELEDKIARAEGEVEVEMRPPCEVFGHNWRDFPPFLTYSWQGETGESYIKIHEYYVCTCCHKREAKTLLSRTYRGYKQDYFFDAIKELKKEYKDILKPEAIVEDMVNDAIMVDRQKLKFWDQLHSPDKLDKEPFTFKLNDKPYEELIDPDEEEE